jgi:hypothetical protein
MFRGIPAWMLVVGGVVVVMFLIQAVTGKPLLTLTNTSTLSACTGATGLSAGAGTLG